MKRIGLVLTLVVLSLILGIATTFEITARQSMLIELVGKDALPNAIGLQSTAFNISRVIGPALTVPLLLVLPKNGEGWIFLLNGLSFGKIILGLFFIRLKYKSEITNTGQSLLRDFLDGGRYILTHKGIAAIILTAAILGMIGLPVMQQIPVLAQDVLSEIGDTKSIVDARNSSLYGSLGFGALIAAVMITMNNSESWRGARLLLGQGAFVAGLIGIGIAREFWLVLSLIALMGWGGVTQFATMNTLLQTKIDNEVRGRVFSIYLWAFQGIAPFGSLLIGWMTQTWNLPVTALTCGLVCLIGVSIIQAAYPDIRKSAA